MQPENYKNSNQVRVRNENVVKKVYTLMFKSCCANSSYYESKQITMSLDLSFLHSFYNQDALIFLKWVTFHLLQPF